jgi:glucose/arabinose dehydrogenase
MNALRTVTIAVVLSGAPFIAAFAAEVIGHNVRPERRDATEDRIRQLRVPPGFAIDVFARNLGNPRMMVVDDQGTVYVSRPETDDVVALTVQDGRADGPPRPILTGLEKAHGLALVRGRLYVAGVYTGTQFPAEYRHDAFVAMRGSWNREPPSGYKVIRVHFKDGQPTGFEDFLGTFLIEGGAAHFGRVAGLAVAKDGALLVSDDTNGVIYRVAYSTPPR